MNLVDDGQTELPYVPFIGKQDTQKKKMKRISDAQRALLAEAIRNACKDDNAIKALEILPYEDGLPDATVKCLAIDEDPSKNLFVLCAKAHEDDLVKRNATRATRAHSLVGKNLGGAVLVPTCTGIAGEYRFATYSNCNPLEPAGIARLLDERRAVRVLEQWLVDVASATRSPCDDVSEFYEAIDHLCCSMDLPAPITRIAAQCRQRLYRGDWVPQWVLMHNDLWRENILHARNSSGDGRSAPYVLIDWAGSRTKGFAFYDLFRLHVSIGRTSPLRFKRTVRRLCTQLSCEQLDVAGYLAAAIGSLGVNPEHFPRKAFVQLAKMTFAPILSTPSRPFQRALNLGRQIVSGAYTA